MKLGDTVKTTQEIRRFATHPIGTQITITHVFYVGFGRLLISGKTHDGTMVTNIPDYALEETI